MNQTLYRNEWLFKHIRRIVNDYLSVKGGSFELFKIRADDIIVECRNILGAMADGYLIAASQGSYTFSRKAFEQADKFMNVTSIGDMAFWRESMAQRYLQQNVTAIKRGVKVTRIFVRPTAKLREAVDILEKHRDAGIDVYVVEPENLPPELNEDFLIMDNRVAIRVEFGTDGRAHTERISIDNMEVERTVKKFEELLRLARKLDEVIDDLKS